MEAEELPRITDDGSRDELSEWVTTLLERHGLLNRYEWGSAVGAKLCDVLFPADENTHPHSVSAMTMQGIIDGVVYAVIARVVKELDLNDTQEEQLDMAMFDKRGRRGS